MKRRNTKRKNLFGFGQPKALSARQTTPAHGGIAEHQAKRAKARESAESVAGSYGGYRIMKTSDGEFYTSLDPDSLFSTKRQAQQFIDWWQKGRGNPAKQSRLERGLEKLPPIAVAQSTARALGRRKTIARKIKQRLGVNPTFGSPRGWWVVNTNKGLQVESATDRVELKGHALLGPFATRSEASNAMKRFNPSKFDRCVKKVKAKGGAVSPHAVCTAAGTRNSGKRKKNPADEAVTAFEEFHGHEPDEIVEVTKRVHFHSFLSGAGTLKRLAVAGIDGKPHLITGFQGALLAFNEQKNQLFVEGGDQAVNLEDYGIDEPHELETLGKVIHIDYATRKDHLGDEGGDAVYTHEFRTTNENGQHVVVTIARYPDLIYRVRDEQLEFSGGSYKIRAEGIDQ